MPTLLRLLFVMGAIGAAGYCALYGIANLVKPQPRLIVEAIALPQGAIGLHTGRSVAEVLDHQAATLTYHRKRNAR